MTELLLHTNSLSGTLPASLSSCTALRDLQVQNNFLSGEIVTYMGSSGEGPHQRCSTSC
jgi:hypothetical protein